MGSRLLKQFFWGQRAFLRRQRAGFDISPASRVLWRDGMDWCVGLGGLGGWGFFLNYQCIESSAFVVQSLVHLPKVSLYLFIGSGQSPVHCSGETLRSLQFNIYLLLYSVEFNIYIYVIFI